MTACRRPRRGSKDAPPVQKAADAPPEPAKKGFFSNLVSSVTGGGTPKKPYDANESKSGQLADDNDFYYNEELKKWVVRGEEDQETEEAAAPPPMAVETPAAAPQGGGMMAAPPAPLPPAPTTSSGRRSRLANLRYVNTDAIGGWKAGASAAPAPAPSSAPSNEPPKPAITMMSFGPQ